MTANEYIKASVDEFKALTVALCGIPAPSHHEDARAEFCLKWFREAGGRDAYIDGAKNVICPFGATDSNELRVFMAHTDTVFPDTVPMPIREEKGRLFCPGVGDDTVNLAALMIMAKYVINHTPPRDYGILFVANSCEEGLGNLKGARALIDAYRERISEVVSFDGGRSLVVRAVGSERWRISLDTEGGHSYGDFGNENAIASLASLIGELYSQSVPDTPDTKTTFNVGCISGGTSVNTIAQHAEMLYEYRSDSEEGLGIMRRQLEETLERFGGGGRAVTLELLGERPGGVPSRDPDRQAALIERGERALRDRIGETPDRRSGSTDCNIPFSLGIPALCLGLVECDGAHTREEYIELDSLEDGLRICAAMLGLEAEG